jgi:photosystem II stability/assembly factor-like uncharacterized protein
MIDRHRILAPSVLALFFAFAAPVRAETVSLDDLRRGTHVHGLAVDRHDPSRLLIATHHGLFSVDKDGAATRIGTSRDDFMGFTPHPKDPKTLFASGHPATGGNTGFIVSRDGGASWERISPGLKGPVDFHQMDVSKSDPNIIYGVYGGLQTSRDGGRSWTMVGPPPAEAFGLAVSARNPDVLFAATRQGLQISKDGGRSWADAHYIRRPASLVHVHDDGSVFAFVVGTGLIKSDEGSLNWNTLNNGFGDRVLVHFAVDSADPMRLFASTQHGEILASTDGGKTWAAFGERARLGTGEVAR